MIIDLETILILVCEALEINPEHMKGTARPPRLADARSLYMFFANKHNFDRDDIGRLIKYKTGACVPYHVNRVETLVKNDRMMQKSYTACSEKIKSWKERK